MPDPIRLLVTGSRGWTDYKTIFAYLQKLRPALVIHGGAMGADLHAGRAAREIGIPVCIFPANWSHYGKSAGSIRNEEMLSLSNPTQGVAFWDGHSSGTVHMIRLCQHKGVPLEVIRLSPKAISPVLPQPLVPSTL